MGCETGKHLLVDGYQHDCYTNANARVRGSAEAQPRKAHMTRSREKLVPRHETESSGHLRGALAFERGEGLHFK